MQYAECGVRNAKCKERFSVGTYTYGQPLIHNIRFGFGACVFVGRRLILRVFYLGNWFWGVFNVDGD